MGELRFFAPQDGRISPEHLSLAYLAGNDGIPTACEKRWNDSSLVVECPNPESGKLYLPWSSSGGRPLMLPTATLQQRPQPYGLLVELARGTVNRLRTQLNTWQGAGISFTDAVLGDIQQCTRLFCQAAASPPAGPLAHQLAGQAMSIATRVLDQMAAEYTAQTLTARQGSDSARHTLLATVLTDTHFPMEGQDELLEVFNTVCVSLDWKQIQPAADRFEWGSSDARIQWCLDHQLHVCCGPLVHLNQASLPPWLLALSNPDQVRESLIRYVQAAIDRYGSRVNLLHGISEINTLANVPWTAEQQLRLAIDTIETIHRANLSTPLIVSFDQPWCESTLAQPDEFILPLHCADMLARADLGIAGFGLEINLGYHPCGSLPRDILQINDQLDLWAQFGLPLVVSISAPNSNQPDPSAHLACDTVGAVGATEDPASDYQVALATQVFPLLLTKPSVQAIFWNQLDDRAFHRFPNSGLIDHQGQKKPTFHSLREIRQKYLV